MSGDKIQEKCAVCASYLFDDDDVVYCPDCGAPHHRDCYNAIGHCGFEQLHGTNLQYKRPTTVENESKTKVDATTSNDKTTCKMCGEEFNRDENSCPNCNTPNMTKMGGRFFTLDLLGGVPPEMDLGDGVTADDAKKFVITNTTRYIPKFASFKVGTKTSWNWIALLSPCGWFMSRKMYLMGCIFGALQVAFTMLLMPFYKAISFIDFSTVTNYMQQSQLIAENIDKIGYTVIVIAVIGVLLDLILGISAAAFGDLIYKKHVISKVKDINADIQTDKMNEFRKKGGVNIFTGVLGYMIVSRLPNIIAILMGIL